MDPSLNRISSLTRCRSPYVTRTRSYFASSIKYVYYLQILYISTYLLVDNESYSNDYRFLNAIAYTPSPSLRNSTTEAKRFFTTSSPRPAVSLDDEDDAYSIDYARRKIEEVSRSSNLDDLIQQRDKKRPTRAKTAKEAMRAVEMDRKKQTEEERRRKDELERRKNELEMQRRLAELDQANARLINEVRGITSILSSVDPVIAEWHSEYRKSEWLLTIEEVSHVL